MKHVSDGAVYQPAQSKCKVCGAYYPHYGDGEGCTGPAPMPTPAQQAAAWAGAQPPKEPRDAQMLRLRSDLLACVTLAGDLLEPVPRRVVAWRYITDWTKFPWVDGEPSPELLQALPGSGWRIERAYSE